MVHADETGWRIGRVNAWLWVCRSQTVTVDVSETSRGQAVPEAILGPAFEGILVVEGLKSYAVLAYRKGQGVGQVRRRTGQLAATLTGLAQYDVQELPAFLREALAVAQRREQLTESGSWRRGHQLAARWDTWLVWHGAAPREDWLRVLSDPAVPATNNPAERMLRPAVLWRKSGGCHTSPVGALGHGVLASLAVSCTQQGKRFVDLAVGRLRALVPHAIPLEGLPDG